MLICLDHLLLTYGTIALIQALYLDDVSLIDTDPYLTPIVMDDSVIEKLPPITFYVGTNDPLYDDSVRFLQKCI